MTFTLGTHNLHDEAGRVTLFADVILFTEAIPRRVRDKVKAASSRVVARARGRAVVVCGRQPDLVVVLRRALFKVTGRTYTHVVDGVAGVTPNRGTFVVLTRWRVPTRRRPRAFVVSHRINAAFYPYVRGEAKFRRDAWHRHTAVDADIVRRLIDSGYDVDAGGDANTPPTVPAWAGVPALDEVGTKLDRLASSDQLDQVVELGKAGSDHPRLRARVS